MWLSQVSGRIEQDRSDSQTCYPVPARYALQGVLELLLTIERSCLPLTFDVQLLHPSLFDKFLRLSMPLSLHPTPCPCRNLTSRVATFQAENLSVLFGTNGNIQHGSIFNESSGDPADDSGGPGGTRDCSESPGTVWSERHRYLL